MKRLLTLVLAVAGTVSVAVLLAPSSRAQSGLTVRRLMKPDEFRAAGLNKLTAGELATLDEWLVAYTQTVMSVARQPSAAAPAAEPAASRTPTVIETCIEGDFNGWEGETIFKLCNGQIWQQAEYDYMYSYSYRPDVVIYQTAAGHRMKVEDEDETILVKRLK